MGFYAVCFLYRPPRSFIEAWKMFVEVQEIKLDAHQKFLG